MRKRLLLCLGLLLVALQLAAPTSRESVAAPLAPDFWLPDLTGRMLSLSDHRGQVVLLDFWATWCLPCRISIPEVVTLQEKYRDQGLSVLGVSLDDSAQASDAYLRVFAQKLKMNYPVLRYNRKVMQDYFPTESPPIPTMFVIDRDGRIRDKLVGFRPGAAERAIGPLLE